MELGKKSNIIKAFADSVTDFSETSLVPDRLFLVFTVCAFFRGAQLHLGMRSDLEDEEAKRLLALEITRLCKLNPEMALDAINNVEPYANKYFVIEYIMDKGRQAAEKWLNCEDVGDEDAESPLRKLVMKYRDLTLADLGIEGVNREYQLQQKQLFNDLDKSVGQLRRRSFLNLLFVITVVLGGLYLLQRL